MVFIRNIMNLHKEMLTGEVLELHYTSHKSSLICKEDKLETCNGDLKVTRHLKYTGKRCVVLIDTSEVERVILREGDDL